MTPLHLFPAYGFDRSTTTPVLLGVLVSWMLTETFGWVFAGLVVPGYLAAVFVLDPRAGVVDVVEALCTYGLARLLGEHLSRTGITSRVFGRERFLLVVVCSVIVRLLAEGAILPRYAPHASGEFFSIGLVVVPLAANACWKTGLSRGVVQNGVPTLIVYALLRWVLIPHTNLSLAGFELATEDIAASFLASPKAYIILTTGAVIAASANVLDGWDFSGILVPALLALVVIEPNRFAATFVEAIVLASIGALVLRATPLSRANVEGPRKIVLFFSIDYALRFAVAGALGRHLPGGDVTNLMGFGYLIPTLLAVKIAQKQSFALVLLPTAQVSLVAFVVGTAIGFAALLLDTSSATAREAVHRAHVDAPAEPIAAALWTASLARPAPVEAFGPPYPTRAMIDAMESYVARGPAGAPSSVASAPTLDAQWLSPRAVLFRERFEHAAARVGDPAVILAVGGPRPGRRVLALVLEPLAHPELAAAAAGLLVHGDVDGVVLAGLEEDPLHPATTDAPRHLARALADRGDGEGSVVLLREGGEHAAVTLGPRAGGERFGALIARVRTAIGDVPARAPDTHDARDALGKRVDALLELPATAIEALLPELPRSPPLGVGSPTVLAALFDAAAPIAPGAGDDVEDRLALRRLVLEPLLSEDATVRSVPMLRRAADALGYTLRAIDRWSHDEPAWALLPSSPRAAFGLIARKGGVRGRTIETVGAEGNRLRDLALRLGGALDVDALILGFGARSEAERLAHVAATLPSEGRAPAIVLLRRGPAEWRNAGVAEVSTWGGAARVELGLDVGQALGRLGVVSADGPLPLVVRELAGRAVFGEVPLAAVTLDAHALHDTALDGARAAVDALIAAGVPVQERPVAELAAELSRALGKSGPSLPEAAAIVQRAVAESSVVARRALSAAVAHGAAAVAIARELRGEVLVVVARDGAAFVVVAAPLDPNARRAAAPEVAATSLGDCAPVLASSGVCRVGAR